MRCWAVTSVMEGQRNGMWAWHTGRHSYASPHESALADSPQPPQGSPTARLGSARCLAGCPAGTQPCTASKAAFSCVRRSAAGSRHRYSSKLANTRRVQRVSRQLHPRFQSALSLVRSSGGHLKSQPKSMACRHSSRRLLLRRSRRSVPQGSSSCAGGYKQRPAGEAAAAAEQSQHASHDCTW